LISSTISDDGKYIAISDLYETKLFNLSSPTPTAPMRPIRIKSFLETLASSPLLSHLDIASKGLGASTLIFTPDSRRLVLAHAQSGNIVVVELGEKDVQVVKCFKVEGNMVHGRVIAGTPKPKGRRQKTANGNGHKHNNGHVNGNGTVNGNGDEEMPSADEDDDEEDSEVRGAEEAVKEDKTWISCLAASNDGQWLVSSDTNAKVTIFNLDTLQVSPSFPSTPFA